MNKGKSLLANIIQFGLSTFLPKAITFLMVPLYTYCLTTAEYGTVDLLNTTVQFILPFVTLQVQDAIFRFSVDERHSPADVYTIGIRILCIGTAIFSTMLLVGRWAGLINIDYLYVVFLIIAVFTSGFRNICIYFCKGIDKIKCITASNVCTTTITAACNLCFLLLFKWGVNGYLAAMCLGSAFGGLWVFIHARLYKHISLRLDNIKLVGQIVTFSIPMVFSALSWWMNNSIDKYVLRYYTDDSMVGILAAAYKIPAILSLFGIAVSSAYSVSAVMEFDRQDKDGFLGYSYHTISSCYVLVCAALIVSNVFLSRLLFSNDFFVAWKYVPPLIYSALFSLLSLTCEQFFVAMQKTNIISITAVVGAMLNFLLNIALIPHTGIYGAAVATSISFFVVWICRYLVLKKHLHMKNRFLNECISYILLLVMVIFAYDGTRYLVPQMIVLACLIILNKNSILSVLYTIFPSGKCRTNNRYE